MQPIRYRLDGEVKTGLLFGRSIDLQRSGGVVPGDRPGHQGSPVVADEVEAIGTEGGGDLEHVDVAVAPRHAPFRRCAEAADLCGRQGFR